MATEHGSVDLHLKVSGSLDGRTADRELLANRLIVALTVVILLAGLGIAYLLLTAPRGAFGPASPVTSAPVTPLDGDSWIPRSHGTSIVRHRLVYPETLRERRPIDEVRSQIERALDTVEGQLGALTEGIEIRIEDSVHRPGQSLGSNSHWTGNVTAAADGPAIVQIRFEDLGSDEELRFYLALAKLREDERTAPSRLVRLGIAHCLRHDDGFDPVSYRLLTTRRPLSTREEYSLEELRSDGGYRDRARGTSWGVIYLLSRIEHRPLRELATLTPKELPELWEKLPRIREAASMR